MQDFLRHVNTKNFIKRGKYKVSAREKIYSKITMRLI